MRSVLPLIATVALAATVEAAPLPTAATGTATHGSQIAVRGSGFGFKSPAAPLVWDDGSSEVPLDSRYDETLPSSAQQGGAFNMAYRQVPFRGIQPPHPHGMRYILGGAHATNTAAGMYASGNNVSIGKNMRSFQYFVQYWYRVDPLFDEEDHPDLGENMKELCLSGAENQVYGGLWGYYSWCTSHVPDVNFTSGVRLARVGVDCPSAGYPCSSDQYAVTHNSPVRGWIKMQWEGGYDTASDNPTVRFTTFPDGHVTELDHYGRPITTYEITTTCGNPPPGQLRFLGIGGFARVPRQNNGTNSYRYFAGVYLDNTYSRAMLGDREDLASCTVLEPQIPLSWTDDSIQLQVNLGALPDSGTVYLFVFDAANQHNARGFPVSLAVGGQPPSTPQNLHVDQP